MAKCLGKKTIREEVQCVQGTAILEKQPMPDDSFHPLALLKTWYVQGSPSKPDMSQGLEGLLQALQELLVEVSKQGNVAEYEPQLFRTEASG